MTHSGKQLAQVGAISFILFGLATARAASPLTVKPANLFIDLLYWPIDGGEAIETKETRLLASIGGGVMVGWGTMLLLITNQLFDDNRKLWSQLISTGLVSWYLVDSTGSALSGSWLNVALNLFFPIIFYLAWRFGKPNLVA